MVNELMLESKNVWVAKGALYGDLKLKFTNFQLKIHVRATAQTHSPH